MLVRSDITELSQFTDTDHAVKVVQSIERFEWPSLMLFNNAECKELTPEYVEKENPFKLKWARTIGDLPSEWNHVVGYCKPRPDAKVVHFTAGIPCWPETENCEYAEEWKREFQIMNSTVSWQELMGNSVHVDKVKRA